MKNDHSIWLNFKDLSNKTVLAFWQSHMRTVISFRLKTIRKSGEDHNLISSFGGTGGRGIHRAGHVQQPVFHRINLYQQEILLRK